MAEPAETDALMNDGSSSWVPRVDMEFDDDEEAYRFYNSYARVMGFSVRKAWINRRASGVIISRTYVCYKEGYQGNRKDESEVKKPRRNERTGCLAHMTIKITAGGGYRVTEFHPMHNHELVPPTKAYLLKSHRALKKTRAAVPNAMSQKAAIEYLVKQAGGYKQVSFFSVEDAADMGWAPKVDMEFDNDEKAHRFYIEYANRIGFDVRKAWVNRKSSGVIISRTYVCYKEGYYGNKKDESQVHTHRLRLNERTGCQARMIIKLAKNGRYHVIEFQPIHNHEFVTARTAHTLKSNREATKANTTVVGVVNDPMMTLKSDQDYVDGQNDARALPTSHNRECRNYLPLKNKDSLKLGDVGALMQYMQERQVDDTSFYYAVQLDKEDKITNVFWTDGRSAVDYNYFGDVVCFDTTYKPANYARPFTPFYGVNHHQRVVFFGAALLYDESEESLKWLFETFKTAMHGKLPKLILTDQHAALSIAITSVWQGTTHRICVWHVYQNAAKHLYQVFQGSRTFACDFGRCVYDCEEEDEFISAWEEMLKKYDLKENIWLCKLFEDREKWALPYGREVFCADIKSMQRMEALDKLLKEYLNPEHDLLQFLRYYKELVDERRQEEMQADFHATQITSIVLPSRMLRQAANVYTPAAFNMFQTEFEMSMDCMVYNRSVVGTIFEYAVTTEENTKEHLVRFDSLDGALGCSCKKFEFIGIQCRHVLKSLDILNIKELPPQYILKRWRKDAKIGSVRCDFLGGTGPKSIKINRYLSLCQIFSAIASKAAETVEGYSFIENQSEQLMNHVYQILQTRSPEKSQFD